MVEKVVARNVDTEGDDLSISTMPQAMVLFNPVLSFESEQILVRLGDKKHLAKRISPTAHLQRGSPPALILFGTDDRLKVFGDSYWEKAEGLGARADKYLAEGQGHGFFNRSPWKERTMIAADEFLTSLGLLKGKPTVKVPEKAAQTRQPTSPGSDQNPQRNREVRSGWRAMDTDGDEKISKEEAKRQIKSNFEQIDTNGDGFIDRTELQALARRLGQRRDG